MTYHEEQKEFREERQSEFEIWKTRAYWIGIETTLADASLEEGDTLPDDSNAEILSVERVILAKGKERGGQQLVLVKGWKPVAYA